MLFAIEGRSALPVRRGGGPTGPGRLCRITLAADLPVNSAHTHFRSSENTSGLTSEYLQKGTKVPGDVAYLWAVADSRIKRSVHGANAREAKIFSSWPDREPH
jgi:hypothetical protein